MLLYEMMSGFKNYHLHRYIGRGETLRMAPGLSAEALIGGYLYYDAIVSDHRWTVETVKDGVRNGGLAVNHAPIITLLKNRNKITGVTFYDQLCGTINEARARTVVNATGVWADRIRRLDRSDVPNLVRLSKGTHLLFGEEDLPLNISTVFTSPVDSRPLFLVKRDGCFLYGTTDDWEDSDPATPIPGERDVGYLLESLRRFMPNAELGREKLRSVYSGFRPLLDTNKQNDAPSSASREDLVEVSPSGLVTVVGGKLTTARLIAARVLDSVIKKMGHPNMWPPCNTQKLSIGGTEKETNEGLIYWIRQCPQLATYFRTLYRRYGMDAQQICTEVLKNSHGEYQNLRTKQTQAELGYICRNEMLCTLEDLCERRTALMRWSNETRLAYIRYNENILRDELGMNKEEFEENFRHYKNYLKQTNILPETTNTYPVIVT
jgi:glycerol-3-phosphate dehydrogenase